MRAPNGAINITYKFAHSEKPEILSNSWSPYFSGSK